MTELTQSIAKELFDYDPENGVLIFRPRLGKWFANPLYEKSWNTRFAGKPALDRLDQTGYFDGTVLGIRLKAHRVIWLLVNGHWPNQIDHINGVRSDNRICNLRDVDNQKNQQNCCIKKNNNSGITGVFWNKASNRWHAQIGSNNKTIDLGRFNSIEEAKNARKAAELKYSYHPNHGRHAYS